MTNDPEKPVAEIDVHHGKPVEDEMGIADWLKEGPDYRTGTHCKCGAHVSLAKNQGGAEWLAGHVAEHHAAAIDWPALIRKALAMAPDICHEFLSGLVGEGAE